MEYVCLGIIKDSFGLDGTIKIYSTTNMSAKRYKIDAMVFLYNPQSNTREEHKVLSYRHSGLFDFVKLNDIDTPEQVKTFKGYEIHAIKDQKDLEKGEYFYSDLKKCNVVDEQGNLLGKVKEVEEFPAQLTLRVGRANKPDFFVPFIKEFILGVNIEKHTICVKIIEGLL